MIEFHAYSEYCILFHTGEKKRGENLVFHSLEICYIFREKAKLRIWPSLRKIQEYVNNQEWISKYLQRKKKKKKEMLKWPQCLIMVEGEWVQVFRRRWINEMEDGQAIHGIFSGALLSSRRWIWQTKNSWSHYVGESRVYCCHEVLKQTTDKNQQVSQTMKTVSLYLIQ